MRPAASSSSGLSVRKRSSKNLLIDSDASLGTNLQPQSSSKGSRRLSPRGASGRVSDAALVQLQAQLSRKWMFVFVAYTVCLALLVGVAIERSDRQWRTVNARLDALLSKFGNPNHIETSDFKRKVGKAVSGNILPWLYVCMSAFLTQRVCWRWYFRAENIISYFTPLPHFLLRCTFTHSKYIFLMFYIRTFNSYLSCTYVWIK